MAEAAQHPFEGYTLYVTFHEKLGRRMAQLVKTATDRTTMSYARYLMSVKLGYIIPEEFHVDHRNDDKTDDDINNLQLLTKRENDLKEQYRYLTQEQVHYGYVCANCETNFILTERQVKMRLKQTRSGLAFCSRNCARAYPRN